MEGGRWKVEGRRSKVEGERSKVKGQRWKVVCLSRISGESIRQERYYVIMYRTVLYCSVLCCTVQCRIVMLYCTVLYSCSLDAVEGARLVVADCGCECGCESPINYSNPPLYIHRGSRVYFQGIKHQLLHSCCSIPVYSSSSHQPSAVSHQPSGIVKTVRRRISFPVPS